MSSPTNSWGIAISFAPLVLPPAILTWLNQLPAHHVQRVDWHHMTLAQFPFAVGRLDELSEQLKVQATACSPFTIEIDAIRSFRAKGVLYLRARKTRQLIMLRKTMLQLLTREPVKIIVQDWFWTPHITVGYASPVYLRAMKPLAPKDREQWCIPITSFSLRDWQSPERLYALGNHA